MFLSKLSAKFSSTPSHFCFINRQPPNKLNGVTKIVNGITQRFQQRLGDVASTASTLDALQDRIVQLEKEIYKLKSDNEQLSALKEKAVADAEALKKKHHAQKQKIEQIAEERDGALQRLEKLEVTFRGCFSEGGPGVRRFVGRGLETETSRYQLSRPSA